MGPKTLLYKDSLKLNKLWIFRLFRRLFDRWYPTLSLRGHILRKALRNRAEDQKNKSIRNWKRSRKQNGWITAENRDNTKKVSVDFRKFYKKSAVRQYQILRGLYIYLNNKALDKEIAETTKQLSKKHSVVYVPKPTIGTCGVLPCSSMEEFNKLSANVPI